MRLFKGSKDDIFDGMIMTSEKFCGKADKALFSALFFSNQLLIISIERASLALSWSAPHKKSAFTIIGFPFIF